VLGFRARPAQLRLPPPPVGRAWTAILSTHEPLPLPTDGQLRLRPLEAAVFIAR
jgi:hypothetical protein